MSTKPLNYQIDIKDIYKLAHFESVEAVFQHVNNQLNTHLGDVSPEQVVEIFVKHATEAYSQEMKERMLTKVRQDLVKFAEANS
jgi:hypothetical protein